jgi:hypothetical protein
MEKILLMILSAKLNFLRLRHQVVQLLIKVNERSLRWCDGII